MSDWRLFLCICSRVFDSRASSLETQAKTDRQLQASEIAAVKAELRQVLDNEVQMLKQGLDNVRDSL